MMDTTTSIVLTPGPGCVLGSRTIFPRSGITQSEALSMFSPSDGRDEALLWEWCQVPSPSTHPSGAFPTACVRGSVIPSPKPFPFYGQELLVFNSRRLNPSKGWIPVLI